MNICDILENQRSFRMRGGVSIEKIHRYEEDLELSFSDEYKEYLMRFGVVSIYGHEFTGICDTPRLDVMEITQIEKKYNKWITGDMYVLEQTNIDGIVIWQTVSGDIFKTVPYQKPIKIYKSFVEYVAES